MMTMSHDGLGDRWHSLDPTSYVELRVKKGRGTITFIEKGSLRKTCELCTQFSNILEAFKKPETRIVTQDSFSLHSRQFSFTKRRSSMSVYDLWSSREFSTSISTSILLRPSLQVLHARILQSHSAGRCKATRRILSWPNIGCGHVRLFTQSVRA